MKTKPLLFLFLFLFITTLLLTCRPSIFSKKIRKENKKLIGQTAPNDMIFIPGTREIPSFYMSVSEEPNIHYLIYLKWLQQVYGDNYPDVVSKAQLTQHTPSDLFKFNDPYITSYMTHPAFSYYPVTGLSWLQIQNYLQWKTDRLNEAILMENGILNFNPEQLDEDNFNTEAFLNFQYEGIVRKTISHSKLRKEEEIIRFNDGVLLCGFRLPTEAEWEHASQPQFQKSIDKKRCLDPFSKNSINHPYGQNYFTLRWGEFYEKQLSNPYKENSINISTHRNKGFPYTPDEHDKNGTPKRLTSIGDYSPKEYGLINMETNVRELVLDKYENEFDSSIQNPLVILKKSGFKTKDAAILDSNGYPVEKDSLGRMRDFRILGIALDGKALEIGNYHPEMEENYKAKHILIQEKQFINEQFEKLKIDKTNQEKISQDLKLEIEIFEYLLSKNQSKETLNRIKNHETYINNSLYSHNPFLLKKRLKNKKIQLDYNNPEFLKSRFKIVNQKLETINQFLNNNTPVQRLVKGGTWENPGKHRMPLEENSSDVEVGFRTILPYIGMPVDKKLKVKWKK